MERRDDFRIEKVNGGLIVKTPYNTDFVKGIKAIRDRRWDASKKAWIVPEEALEDVRRLMQKVYGRTDEEPTETVDLEVYFDREVRAERTSISMFGINIATAWGRDTGAKLADNVEVIAGEVISGGSRNYWSTIITEGTVIRLYGVPVEAFENEKLGAGVEVEVLNHTTTILEETEKDAEVTEKKEEEKETEIDVESEKKGLVREVEEARKLREEEVGAFLKARKWVKDFKRDIEEEKVDILGVFDKVFSMEEAVVALEIDGVGGAIFYDEEDKPIVALDDHHTLDNCGSGIKEENLLIKNGLDVLIFLKVREVEVGRKIHNAKVYGEEKYVWMRHEMDKEGIVWQEEKI